MRGAGGGRTEGEKGRNIGEKGKRENKRLKRTETKLCQDAESGFNRDGLRMEGWVKLL
jgi:hypothetical protein